MASEPGHIPQRKSRYAGEDTSRTTPKELLGWYSYGIAAEVFAVCGVGKHITPILLFLSMSKMHDQVHSYQSHLSN